MPVYNAARHVASTVASILAQSHEDFAFLVIDDGSTDETRVIIEGFKDPRIGIVSNPGNLGLIATLNRSFDLVSSDYLVKTDADDISTPDRIATLLAFMEANPDVDVCGSDAVLFGGDPPSGRPPFQKVVQFPRRHEEIVAQLAFGCPMPHGGVVFRTRRVVEAGVRYREAYRHAEDWDFWNQCRSRLRLANVPALLYFYRDNPAGISRSRSEEQVRSSMKVVGEVLRDMGAEASEADVRLHFDLLRPTGTVPPWAALRWLHGLKRANRRSRLFDRRAFDRQVDALIFQSTRDHKLAFAAYSAAHLLSPDYLRFLARRASLFFGARRRRA
jgi:glycosyltransferase involved in cell wall biosynthesis